MEHFMVKGMTCAACSARVEKAARSVPGVTDCSVNLLTGDMTVEGQVSPQEVEKAGYQASTKGGEKTQTPKAEKATGNLPARLISSLIFLGVLMYISMGRMLWDVPLPAFLEQSSTASGIAQLLFSGIILVINQRFFISGARSLLHGAPNMDTLVALGAGVSYAYSTVLVFAMAGAEAAGEAEKAAHMLHGLYFESAAMILALITLGKLLEARAKGKTTKALEGLMALAPQTAVVLVDGKEQEIPIEKLKVGDIFVVRPGGRIPVDGEIVMGQCAVDQSALTGESIPVDLQEGDRVYAACINMTGYIQCKALRVGEDTTLAQMIALRYGTIPIVRETGGLKDTVLPYNKFEGTGRGFTFSDINAGDMLWVIREAVDLYHNNKEAWRGLQKEGMTADFSWDHSAQEYIDIYQRISG